MTKIVIRNVGVLRSFKTPNETNLDKLTLVYGRNGRGKSTLTSILRAARDANPAIVMGRQSLGNGGEAPHIVLTSSASSALFKDGRWNTEAAPIEVFDTTFIADNVFAGELIDLSHDRGLFSIIIGADGVRYAKHLDRFNIIAKNTGAALKAADAALTTDLPTDMGRDEFFRLGFNPAYEQRLDTAERTLSAVRQADKLAALRELETVSSFEFPADIGRILGSTIADIDATARDRLRAHFKRFGFDKNGESWLTYGVEHIHDDACPLCGRDDVDSEGMVSIYGQIFSETYKAHLAAINGCGADLEQQLGEASRRALTTTVANNATAASKWSAYVRFGRELPNMAECVAKIADAHELARTLLERKRSSPLEVMEEVDDLGVAAGAIIAARQLVDTYNETIGAMNEIIRAARVASNITESEALLARDNVKKRIARQDPGVQGRIIAYSRAKNRDARTKAVRTKIQAALKKANESAAAHYHAKVNHYLERFSASFTISEISNSMQGNSGQSDYGLLIKGEAIKRGRGRISDAEPTFRNTLSAGDKTTLAFAFFLAKLDHDPLLASKIVVIDDPLSSHDSHRRRETVERVKDLCSRCMQVLVLSHDEFLLHQVQRRCVGVPSAAIHVDLFDGDGWSTAKTADFEQLCLDGHPKLVGEITAFVENRRGHPDDVVLKIRLVLETHFRRSYSAYFARNLNLGQIVKNIRTLGNAHPCFPFLAKLDACDDATCNKHHGDDGLMIEKRGVDPDDLRVIAIDALELIGARRRTGPTITVL
nr:AAA family ATPase [uncultured Novosphingobium sp.]